MGRDRQRLARPHRGGRARARRDGRARAQPGAPARATARQRRSLAFTDADSAAARLARAPDRAAEAGEPLVAGRVVVTTQRGPNRDRALRGPVALSRRPATRMGPTANLGMRREAFDAIGGFDAGYRHIGEDVDLCLRAGAAGYPLTRCPDAIVEHPPPRPSCAQCCGARSSRPSRSMTCTAEHGLQAGRYWRNPGPLVRGDWALRRFGIDPQALPAGRAPCGPPDRARRVRRSDGRLAVGAASPPHDRISV